MASLQEFLLNNSHRISTKKLPIIEADVRQDTSEITLSGILVSATSNKDEKNEDDYIVFSHLGQRFYINSGEVNDIEESLGAITNPEPPGVSVRIKVKANTQLIPYEVLTAIDLNSKEPYAIARPSQISQIDNSSFTAKELAWLADKTIPNNTEIRSATVSTICYLRGRPVDDTSSND